MQYYREYVLSLSRQPGISRDVSADASFLYDKTAVLGAEIKETLCINWRRWELRLKIPLRTEYFVSHSAHRRCNWIVDVV